MTKQFELIAGIVLAAAFFVAVIGYTIRDLGWKGALAYWGVCFTLGAVLVIGLALIASALGIK